MKPDSLYTYREPHWFWVPAGILISVALHQGLSRWLVQDVDNVWAFVVEAQVTAALLFLVVALIVVARRRGQVFRTWTAAAEPFAWAGFVLLPVGGVLYLGSLQVMGIASPEPSILLLVAMFSFLGLPLMVTSVGVYCLVLVKRRSIEQGAGDGYKADPAGEPHEKPGEIGGYTLRRPLWLWIPIGVIVATVLTGLGWPWFGLSIFGYGPVAGLLISLWICLRGPHKTERFFPFVGVCIIACMAAFIVVEFSLSMFVSYPDLKILDPTVAIAMGLGLGFFTFVPASVVFALIMLKPVQSPFASDGVSG